MHKAERILLWSSNLFGFGAGMLGPLYAVFAQRIGGDVFEISWVYSLYLFTMGIGMVIVGRIGDKIGHEILSVVGYALSTIAAFSYLFVNSIPTLLIVQMLNGLGIAVNQPSWYALYDKHSGDGTRDGYVWGLASGMWYIFQGAAILLGGLIVTTISFMALFWCMGTVLVVATLVQARMLSFRKRQS